MHTTPTALQREHVCGRKANRARGELGTRSTFQSLKVTLQATRLSASHGRVPVKADWQSLFSLVNWSGCDGGLPTAAHSRQTVTPGRDHNATRTELCTEVSRTSFTGVWFDTTACFTKDSAAGSGEQDTAHVSVCCFVLLCFGFYLRGNAERWCRSSYKLPEWMKN